MAQSTTTDSGTVIIPDVYSKITVQTSNSGLATTGVLVLMGEADGGPDFSEETDLQVDASYGPDQYGAVQAKYQSGPIVDAFRTAAQPSNDAQIPGSPNRIIIVKTNASTKASADLLNPNSSVYSAMEASAGGALGNLVYFNVTAQASEVVPTTGAFTWIHPAGTANIALSVNGVITAVAIAANLAPSAFVTAVNAASAGVTATGGAVIQYVTISGTLAVAASGNTITVTRSVNWNVTPAAGDTLTISSTSVIKGASGENIGSYVVTSATPTTVVAVKKSDGATGATGTPGSITAPANVAAQAIVSTTVDLQGYGTVTIANNVATLLQGVGKSLEFAELTTGTDLVSRYVFSGVTAVTWVSKASSAQLLSSATEQRVTTNVSRSVDNVQETWNAGGEIGLKVSYKGGTAATMTITDEQLTTTVTGGSGDNQTFLFEQGGQTATIADLVNFLSAQTGYSASVGTTAIGQLPVTALDQGVFNIASSFGAKNGRIKTDSYRYAQAVVNNSVTVTVERADAGIPAVQAVTYLSGGAKGSTSDADVVDALTALESVQCNFIIPLFSRDASDDITDGLTDAASTYTIDAINANCRTHVLSMSTLKRKRNRQAFLSFKGTFTAARDAAANISSFRCSMNFQDIKVSNSTGAVTQFAPWMGAVAAAGMQAAGFYRPIVNKFINISGALQAAGDFNDQNITDMENALLAGLLPVVRGEAGGFRWVSDQTTYGKDNNFSLNSIQATYITDIVALSSAQQMRNAFVGQALSDVSPGILLSYFEGLMAEFMRLKLLAPSSDAPGGFKNASVIINGPVFVVNAEIKIAGALYFGLLNFLVSQVTGSASSTSSNG